MSSTKTFVFTLCKRYAKFYLNYWFIFFVFVPIGIFFFDRPLEAAYGENANLIKSFISDLFGQQSFNSYNITWWFNAIILALWVMFPFLYIALKNIFIAVPLLIFFFINPGDILYALHFIVQGLGTFFLSFTLGVFIALHIDKISRILNLIHPYVVLAFSLIAASILLFLRGFPVFENFTGFKVDPFATVFVALAVVSLCRATGWRFAFM